MRHAKGARARAESNMKKGLFIAGLLAVSVAGAGASGAATVTLAAVSQKYSFLPGYKQGESLKYSMTMVMEGSMSITSSSNLEMTYTKVYPDGSADMKMAITDMSSVMNGQAMNMPDPPVQTFKVTKYGEMQGSAKGMNFGSKIGPAMAKLMEKGIAPGETIKVDQTDKDSKTHVWGTVTCVNVTDGIINLTEDLQVSTGADSGKTPMHIVGKEGINSKTHILETSDTEMTNLESGAAASEFSKITVKMKLLSYTPGS